MVSVNPVPLIEVRCQNVVTLKDGRQFQCNRKLAEVEEGRGTLKCPKCKHLNRFEVVIAGSGFDPRA